MFIGKIYYRLMKLIKLFSLLYLNLLLLYCAIALLYNTHSSDLFLSIWNNESFSFGFGSRMIRKTLSYEMVVMLVVGSVGEKSRKHSSSFVAFVRSLCCCFFSMEQHRELHRELQQGEFCPDFHRAYSCTSVEIYMKIDILGFFLEMLRTCHGQGWCMLSAISLFGGCLATSN